MATGTRSRDLLSFRRGAHRFAIDASCVAFVHDTPPDGASMPLLDVGELLHDDLVASGLHHVRVRTGDASFDLATGVHLRVIRVDDNALAPIPVWLAGVAERAALAEISVAGDDALWLFDARALARRALVRGAAR